MNALGRATRLLERVNPMKAWIRLGAVVIAGVAVAPRSAPAVSRVWAGYNDRTIATGPLHETVGDPSLRLVGLAGRRSASLGVPDSTTVFIAAVHLPFSAMARAAGCPRDVSAQSGSGETVGNHGSTLTATWVATLPGARDGWSRTMTLPASYDERHRTVVIGRATYALDHGNLFDVRFAPDGRMTVRQLPEQVGRDVWRSKALRSVVRQSESADDAMACPSNAIPPPIPAA